jgi:hypothetical protein
MSTVKRLWPDRDELGQCQASREGRYANDKPNTISRCTHTAKYEIEGKRLCTKHAECAALRILLEQKP